MMIRNLPLLTFAAIFVSGMVLAGMALIQPLGFADRQIIPWTASASQYEMQIVIDSNAVRYFAERDSGKTVESH